MAKKYKEFEELYGNRVYLEIPKKEETKVIVDDNTKESLNKAMLEKMNKLKVYAVGVGVKFDEDAVVVRIGDEVLVDPQALARAPLIPLSPDRDVLMVSIFDVIHKW